MVFLEICDDWWCNRWLVPSLSLIHVKWLRYPSVACLTRAIKPMVKETECYSGAKRWFIYATFAQIPIWKNCFFPLIRTAFFGTFLSDFELWWFECQLFFSSNMLIQMRRSSAINSYEMRTIGFCPHETDDFTYLQAICTQTYNWNWRSCYCRLDWQKTRFSLHCNSIARDDALFCKLWNVNHLSQFSRTKIISHTFF